MTPEATRSEWRPHGPWLLPVAVVMVAVMCVVAMVLEFYAKQDQVELPTARRSRLSAETPSFKNMVQGSSDAPSGFVSDGPPR
jgi:hypothetical protein